MSNLIDLTGKKFGRLTVIRRVKNAKSGKSRWLCRCSCSEQNELIVIGTDLTRGHTQSCGCFMREQSKKYNTKHGKLYTRLYKTWKNMKNRCNNPNSDDYRIYGAEGKTVCDEWLNNFQTFYDWSMANGYDETAPKGQCTLERIDGTKGYSPDNCRWATAKEQANNTRRNHVIEYNGKKQTMKQWSEELHIKYSTLAARINTYRWDIDRAFEIPIKNL